MREKVLGKTLLCLIMVLIAVVSFLWIADRATSLESNRAIMASIDEKSETVLKLTAASTLASAGISAIPGDTATPIAQKLADFTEYFLLILCVLYAEKYLLTIIGAAVFKVLIPCACALGIVAAFWNRSVMRQLAVRVALFALAIFIAIPTSIGVSDMVYHTYRSSINAAIADTEELRNETAALSEAGENTGLIAAILDRLSETATGLAEKASKLLNRYVESLAVLIVTSCIIPLLALAFFIWLIKLLTGVNVLRALPHPAGGRKGSQGGAEAP